jgi:hypothetical protein
MAQWLVREKRVPAVIVGLAEARRHPVRREIRQARAAEPAALGPAAEKQLVQATLLSAALLRAQLVRQASQSDRRARAFFAPGRLW